MKTKVFLLSIAMIAMTGAVSAQNTTKQPTRNSQQGVNFVDTNKDGVCDNFEKGNGGNNPKGDGVRLKDGSGRTSGKGKKAFQCQGMRNGQGQGNKNGTGQGLRDGSGNGTGSRGAYVDANKNGVCDNRE